MSDLDFDTGTPKTMFVGLQQLLNQKVMSPFNTADRSVLIPMSEAIISKTVFVETPTIAVNCESSGSVLGMVCSDNRQLVNILAEADLFPVRIMV